MNKNMLAICTLCEGLRNLDKWEDSELKTLLQEYRNSFIIPRNDYFKETLHKCGFPERHIRYADPSGKEITLFEWTLAIKSLDSRVNQSSFQYIEKEIYISTVWLGLNHGWFGNLQIFETMIFGIDDDELMDYQERYATIEQAEEGHKNAVSFVIEYIKKKEKKTSASNE